VAIVQDNRDGTVSTVEKVKYDPYGQPTFSTDAGADATWWTNDDTTDTSSSIGNTLTFQGRRLDTETGLYYFRNRYYSPTLGRFVQRDPLLDGTYVVDDDDNPSLQVVHAESSFAQGETLATHTSLRTVRPSRGLTNWACTAVVSDGSLCGSYGAIRIPLAACVIS
jgi:RHS repeat-associated protein